MGPRARLLDGAAIEGTGFRLPVANPGPQVGREIADAAGELGIDCRRPEIKISPTAWVTIRRRWRVNGRAMQHLICRDVVQHEADRFGSIQPGWHRNQFTLRQADELRVGPVDRHRGNDKAWFDSGGTGAEPFHHTNQIPPRRKGQPGRLGMDALACHNIGQRDTRGQCPHSHFAILRLRAPFLNHPKCIGPAVVSDDDPRVSRRGLPPLPSARTRAAPQRPIGRSRAHLCWRVHRKAGSGGGRNPLKGAAFCRALVRSPGQRPPDRARG